eukprot:TRINITY_DN14982_c0_g1_i2.p1 TRINITY_DN14982_c0_g1~~TRINITY_DN14982_c0_g1_i2.p1  ORF type:complete len:240 (-),score=50.68 TRINITY_DN14982_c0_g1_i2:132-851(-)
MPAAAAIAAPGGGARGASRTADSEQRRVGCRARATELEEDAEGASGVAEIDSALALAPQLKRLRLDAPDPEHPEFHSWQPLGARQAIDALACLDVLAPDDADDENGDRDSLGDDTMAIDFAAAMTLCTEPLLAPLPQQTSRSLDVIMASDGGSAAPEGGDSEMITVSSCREPSGNRIDTAGASGLLQVIEVTRPMSASSSASAAWREELRRRGLEEMRRYRQELRACTGGPVICPCTGA